MNHQQTNRKTLPSLARDPVARTTLLQAKVAEDSNGKRRNRSKSKNKIPKSVRYDLENALVGLCDVWFKDIKPYLVRNNIKVHAAPDEAGKGDEGGAAGDNCSHLDPGAAFDRYQRLAASCADCCSTRPIASRARSHRQPASLSPTQSSCSKCRDSSKPKPRKRGRRRRASDRQHLPPQQPSPRIRSYSIVPHVTCIKLTKATQCPEIRNKRNISPVSNNCVLAPVSTTKKQNKKTQTDTLREPERSQEQKFEPYSKMFGRRNATTTLLPTQKMGKSHEVSPLFQDDLIDIIAEKHEKRLQLLYKCVAFSNEDASTMNLTPSLTALPKISLQKKPWR